MTREKALELSNILKAYSEGKTIQVFDISGQWFDIDKITGFEMNKVTLWNLILRIKPEPKLVPFTFEDKNLFIGKIIKHRRSNLYNIIVGASPLSIWIGSVVNGLTYFELWENYEFEDGSPCGKYIE